MVYIYKDTRGTIVSKEEKRHDVRPFRASPGSPTLESAPRKPHQLSSLFQQSGTCAGQFYSWGEAENVEQDILSRGFNITPRYLFKLSYRLWTLYITLIYMATYKPRYDPKLSLHLDAGEVITTWAALAARLDRTESQVKTDMKKLVSMNAPLSFHNACRCIVVTLSNYKACQDISCYNGATLSLSSRHDAASNTTVQQYNNTTALKEEAASTETDAAAPLVEKTFRDRIGTVDRWTPADAKRVKTLLESGLGADLLCAAIYLAVGRAYTRACREKKEGEPLRAYFRRCPGQVIGSFAYVETVIAEAKAAQALGSIGEIEGFWEYSKDSVERMEAGENE